jgi:hypothetical protein
MDTPGLVVNVGFLQTSAPSRRALPDVTIEAEAHPGKSDTRPSPATRRVT